MKRALFLVLLLSLSSSFAQSIPDECIPFRDSALKAQTNRDTAHTRGRLVEAVNWGNLAAQSNNDYGDCLTRGRLQSLINELQIKFTGIDKELSDLKNAQKNLSPTKNGK